MELVIVVLKAVIVIEHFYILWFEMFAWETVGKKTFKSLPADLFPKTKSLAANQGLYNGFLAAGLGWTFFIEDGDWQHNISIFFLLCIAIAGIYGALSATKKIFFIQALPAILTLLLIFIEQ